MRKPVLYYKHSRHSSTPGRFKLFHPTWAPKPRVPRTQWTPPDVHVPNPNHGIRKWEPPKKVPGIKKWEPKTYIPTVRKKEPVSISKDKNRNVNKKKPGPDPGVKPNVKTQPMGRPKGSKNKPKTRLHHMGEKMYQIATRRRGKTDEPLEKDSVITSTAQGSITKSNFRVTYRANHRIAKAAMVAAVKLNYDLISSYNIQSNIGLQQPTDMCVAPASATEYPEVLAIMGGGGWIQYPLAGDYTKAAPAYCLLVRNALLTRLSGEGPLTSKVYFDNVHMTTTLTNGSTIAVFVDIYEVVAKIDYIDTFLNNVFSPSKDWYYGMQNAANASTSQYNVSNQTSYLFPGAKPWESNVFNTYWEIASKITVELGVGCSHEHYSSYVYNKLLDVARFDGGQEVASTNAPWVCMAGITRSLMFVTRGALVTDSVSKSNVKCGATSVLVEHRIQGHARAFNSSQTININTRDEGTVTIPASANLGWFADTGRTDILGV